MSYLNNNKFILILPILFISCGKKLFMDKKNNPMLISYKVYKIETINDYYLIYASKKDSLYKIVSKKEAVTSKCTKIKLNSYFDFKLHSTRENAPVIGGVKLSPINYLIINCYTYEKDTKICIDVKNGIFDLYYADNVKGLCFIKQ
ncbi:MAG TPA: hypothetical protein VF677_15840 [Flavobacterium sp.]|jgi:hypothetical protein